MEGALAATVKGILEHATAYQGWSLQGLGMLRLRFAPKYRLHVWSHDHKVKDVTPIHDHPWNLVSHVISGEIENILYRIADPEREPVDDRWAYRVQPIKCGPGGCVLDEPRLVYLYEHDRAKFLGGQDYAQDYFEIHESRPSDGAVSLVETWTPSHVDKDRANVFIKEGLSWVSAEPRPATESEVRAITSRALERWSS